MYLTENSTMTVWYIYVIVYDLMIMMYCHTSKFVHLGGRGLFRSDPWEPDSDWESPEACNIMTIALNIRSAVLKESVETNTRKIDTKVFARSDVLQLLKVRYRLIYEHLVIITDFSMIK